MKKIIPLMLIIILFLSIITNCPKQKEMVITIPLVTWGGYAAMFAANNGAEPNEDSLFYKYGKFKVQLVQAEDPALHLTGFAKGDYPILWSTMDMIPLIYDSLSKDAATIPKVIGLFDYSAGGDGIIVRGDKIKSGADFKGKKIAAPQYQPSHFFLLWYLNENNLGPNDIQMVFTEDAIGAKDAYIADDSIDVCVTWSPFIYDITDKNKDTYIPGSILYLTTAPDSPAHGVIADVFLARADFVEQNPKILDAFCKAMVEGYDIWMNDKTRVAKEISALFGITEDDVMAMFGDVIIGSKEEQKKLLTPDYEFSAYNLFKLSSDLYKKAGKLAGDFNVDPKEIVAPKFMLKAIGE